MQGGENVPRKYKIPLFLLNERKLHASYFISKPHKTITQSIFQCAILHQQLLAQFVLWNSTAARNIFCGQRFNQRLHSCVWWATCFSFQHGPNTEVHWVKIGQWRRPQFLAPKPRKIVSAPILGFVEVVRRSTALLDGELFIFEVLFHITQGRGQNAIDVLICVNFGTLFHKVRGNF